MGKKTKEKISGRGGKALKKRGKTEIKASSKISVQTKKSPAGKMASVKGRDVKKIGTGSKASSGKTAPVRKGLGPKDLQYFKSKLLREKQRVLEEMGAIQNDNLKQSITDQTGELSHYSYHLGDTASLAYDREFSMGLAERQQRYLEQIDEALRRIEEGTYGICRVTGELISRERLEEVPVAKYSVKGKEIIERQKRMMAQSQG